MKKFIVLVIYDVVDKLNRKQYDAMMRRASKMINPIEDSLRVYVLDDIINIYTWGIGERKEQDCIVL
ncbi:MAG: CRISPR-associated endonuclease Cas2 [Veillonella sp.]|nr:CRISPR-associated endonuclease Cas2 [Veillonella sp.]